MTAGKPIEDVLREHADELAALPDVVGTAVGEERGEPCIKVYAAAESDELRERVPDVLEGYPVVVQRTGDLTAL